MSADARLEEVLRSMWIERHEDVMGQVAVVEEAVTDALTGTLSEEMRTRATREAHRIAGSVGTFGFEQASRRAREVELALAAGGGPSQEALATLADHVVSIRAELDAGAGERERVLGDPSAEGAPGGLEPLLIAVEGDRGRRILEAALARGWPAWPAGEQDVREATEAALALIDVGAPTGAAVLRAAGGVTTVALVAAGEDSDRLALARLGVARVLSRELLVEDIVAALADVRRDRSLDGASILTVADDPDRLEVAASALADAGARVTAGVEPLAGFELLERTQPDLMVLGGDDASAMCRALRATLRWQALPVVLVTGPDQRDAADAVGADATLATPISAAGVVAAARRAVQRARTTAAAAQGDSLTGAASRHRVLGAAQAYRSLAERTKQPLTLGLFDVDGLSDINSRLGPAAGDVVLRALGTTLDRRSRTEDVVGRWAGDRFIVLWFGLEPNGARRRLDALMDDLRRLRLGPEGRLGFTVSAGLASYPADGDSRGRHGHLRPR